MVCTWRLWPIAVRRALEEYGGFYKEGDAGDYSVTQEKALEIMQAGNLHYIILVRPEETIDIALVRDKRVIISGVFVNNILDIAEASTHLTFIDQYDRSLEYYYDNKAALDGLIAVNKLWFYVDVDPMVSAASIVWCRWNPIADGKNSRKA